MFVCMDLIVYVCMYVWMEIDMVKTIPPHPLPHMDQQAYSIQKGIEMGIEDMK